MGSCCRVRAAAVSVSNDHDRHPVAYTRLSRARLPTCSSTSNNPEFLASCQIARGACPLFCIGIHIMDGQ